MRQRYKWHVYQTTPLTHGNSYLIFNEGNNGEYIFRDKYDMKRFKRKFKDYFDPFLIINAFCLLRNHFHILVTVRKKFKKYDKNKYPNLDEVIARYGDISKEQQEIVTLAEITRRFYMSHAKYFNHKYNRKGSLFRKNYKRVLLLTVDDQKRAIVFIHRNPQKHGVINDFRYYTESSYQIYKDQKKWLHAANKLLNNLFGNLQAMKLAHAYHDDNNDQDIQIEY